jgi:hypothetical protein
VKEEEGLAKCTTAPAISSGSPMRRSADSSAALRAIRSFSHSARENSVRIRPVAMQLTRIPSRPHYFASTWVGMMTAAFEIE